MPIQGLKFNIPTGTETHLSFQATGSFTAYNPNDGYALIALDRTATLLDYDHKIPSQSGGQFPGPINSYLSMYFLDQSGAGLSGQVIVYASPDTLQIPRFWSIGRAIQSQVTSLDLIQGTQPPNPPANTTRLWSDANGHLHLAQSNGTDYTVLDSNNYAAYVQPLINSTALGGDLYGTINNAHINVLNADAIYTTDAGGVSHIYVSFGGEVLYWDTKNGGFRWVNQSNTLQLAALSTVGNFWVAGDFTAIGAASIGGALTAASVTSSGGIRGSDIYASRGDTTGVVYFGNNPGTIYLYYNGSSFSLTSNLDVSGALTTNGNISIPAASVIYIGAAGMSSAIARGYAAYQTVTGQGDLILGGGNSILYLHPNLTVGIQQNSPYFDIFGYTYVRATGGGFVSQTGYYFFNTALTVGIQWDGTYLRHTHSIAFNTTGNQVVWPNGSYISGNAGYVQGSNPSLKHYLDTESDESLLALVTNPKMPVTTYLWENETKRNIGFLATDVAEVLPDYVIRDESGEASGYNPQELMAIVWGAVRALNGRVDDITSKLTA
jgi:hypothetical protein